MALQKFGMTTGKNKMKDFLILVKEKVIGFIGTEMVNLKKESITKKED